MSVTIPIPDITGSELFIEENVFSNYNPITIPKYRINLEQDEDGRIVASSPDLQGLATDGANEDEVIKNVHEAVLALIEAQDLPQDSSLIFISNID